MRFGVRGPSAVLYLAAGLGLLHSRGSTKFGSVTMLVPKDQ